MQSSQNKTLSIMNHNNTIARLQGQGDLMCSAHGEAVQNDTGSHKAVDLNDWVAISDLERLMK